MEVLYFDDISNHDPITCNFRDTSRANIPHLVAAGCLVVVNDHRNTGIKRGNRALAKS